MKKRFVIFALVGLFGFLSAAPARAEEINRLYKGIKPLGMGDAFTAIADDETAAFYNPAGLSSVEKWEVEIFNPKLEVGQNTIDFYNNAKNLNTGDTQAAVNLMRNNMGKHQHVAVDLFPNLTKHNFEIGILGAGSFDAEIHSPAYPVMTVDATTDVGGVIALSHAFMEDRLSLGLTAKYIMRQRYYKDFTAVDIANSGTSYSFDKDLKKGSALGIDVGAIYRVENDVWNPSLGLVIQNIGDMNFGDITLPSTNATVDNKIKQSINLGAAINRKVLFFDTLVALDYRDITNHGANDTDFMKRIHAGVELKFPYILALRAGLSQTYFTFGLGVDVWLLKLQYAYYKEELGAYSGQREDARHVAQLTIGF